MHRRGFLGGVIAGVGLTRWPSRLMGGPQETASESSKDDLQTALDRCKKVGLNRAEIERGSGKLFVAAGDAPAAFRKKALEICESLARSYLEHFKAKGFEVAAPRAPLTIVTLAGLKSFEAFTGEKAEGSGGHYDLETNRLVMFNFLAGDAPEVVRAEATNRLTLIHEAMHELTYNTGLLERNADVPIAISEGFATYAETWNSATRKGFGGKNLGRIAGLSQGMQEAGGWTPLRTLIGTDESFQPGNARLLAYSQSWRLTTLLMQDAARRAKFRGYLTALKSQDDPAKRVALIEHHLGDLDALDRVLRKAAGLRS